MKLKVITPYTDKELDKNMYVGFEFETSQERAKILIDKDFCIDITPFEEILQPIVKQRKTRTKKQK